MCFPCRDERAASSLLGPPTAKSLSSHTKAHLGPRSRAVESPLECLARQIPVPEGELPSLWRGGRCRSAFSIFWPKIRVPFRGLWPQLPVQRRLGSGLRRLQLHHLDSEPIARSATGDGDLGDLRSGLSPRLSGGQGGLRCPCGGSHCNASTSDADARRKGRICRHASFCSNTACAKARVAAAVVVLISPSRWTSARRSSLYLGIGAKNRKPLQSDSSGAIVSVRRSCFLSTF